MYSILFSWYYHLHSFICLSMYHTHTHSYQKLGHNIINSGHKCRPACTLFIIFSPWQVSAPLPHPLFYAHKNKLTIQHLVKLFYLFEIHKMIVLNFTQKLCTHITLNISKSYVQSNCNFQICILSSKKSLDCMFMVVNIQS